MMCDLGFAVKPVLIIDAKATEHILHRRGIGKKKHIDVAHLWLQDEVKSNRLRVRCVKSEDNLADIGTKAISNKIIGKSCDPLRLLPTLRDCNGRLASVRFSVVVPALDPAVSCVHGCSLRATRLLCLQ